jgi:hypothetical protein
LIGLETLELGATRITDAGLAILGRSPSLLHIDTGGTEAVDDARITDAGAVHLAGLPHLWSLRLAHARWTDAGVSAIRKSTPRIVVYQAPSR